MELVNKSPITLEKWNESKTIYKEEAGEDLLRLGFATLFLNRVNRSGILSAGVIGGKNQGGKYKLDARFNRETIVKKIKTIAKHKDSIELYNLSVFEFIDMFYQKQTNNSKDILVFLDPPYVSKGHQLYPKFFVEEEHNMLKDCIKGIPTKWFLTYDSHENIQKLYSEYNGIGFYLNYSVSSKRNQSIEFMFWSDLLKVSDNALKYLNIPER